MSVGKVYLVGAGPGDPGLITWKGLQCLKQADIVLYDGLVNPALLVHTAATAVRTCRSDSPGGRVLKQDEINAHLIAAAQQGKTVVRLKGGDPYVFGRGSEEAAALAEAGIPFEVVPGVTAAVAVSAYAGFSLTHRDHASAVAFVTGHEDPRKDRLSLDYPALVRFPGTLVFYMGLHRVGVIAQALIEAGKNPDTPAAVVSRGTTPAQRVVTGTLATLPSRVQAAGLHAPSLIVVGQCVLQRERIAWFEHLPLFGKRIGVTRPLAQADAVAQKLVLLGAEPVLMPTIAIAPPDDWSAVDAQLARLGEFDWLVFTSVNGVQSLLRRLWETGGDVRQLQHLRLAAIGEGTAQALAEFHLRTDLVPQQYRAEALAAALKPHVTGQRVLWARASRGREVLPSELRSAGAQLEEVVVYQNVDLPSWPEEVQRRLAAGEIDWICLSSPSIARNVAQLLSPAARSQLGQTLHLASISPVTTAAAIDAGLPITTEATQYTWDGLISAICQHAATSQPTT